MGKITNSKIIIGSKTAETRSRSERVMKRKTSSADKESKMKIKKDVVHKTEQKRSLKGKSKKSSKALLSETANKKSIEAPLDQQMDEPPKGVSKKPSEASSTAKKELPEEPQEPSINATFKKTISMPINEQVNELSQAKRGRKTKVIKYEIDCSGINMDTKNFRKDLWDRAKNGKLNSAKNVRIKQTGNIIYLTSRSYVSKKCIRSNIHFLTTIYFKQKKIDHEIRVVGNKNAYTLIHK